VRIGDPHIVPRLAAVIALRRSPVMSSKSRNVLEMRADTAGTGVREIVKPVVCIDNSGYEVSLERRKIYSAISDPRAEALGPIRLIDESAEDYLYPTKNFVRADPRPGRRELQEPR
jgi:hypothetical protein